MSKTRKAVRSVARVRVGRRTVYFIPLRGIAYAAISAAIVCALFVGIDRVVLGSLERGGWTSGELWMRHNKRIEENHRRKTTTNECQLREWNGQPLSPSQGSRKILVMGDSFVWGPPYVTLNHLWWRQLAIELERRGYHDVQVLAVGHPGWSTHRQLDCAKELIPAVKPDIVIWGYVTNDPDEKLLHQIFDSQDQPPYGQRIRQQFKRWLPNLAFKFESLRADKLAEQYAGPEYGYAYPDWELKLLEGDNFARYRHTIADVGALVGQTNVPTFLLTLPHFPNREYFDPRYAPALKLWDEAGVPVLNTLDDFIDQYGEAPATGPEALKWGVNPADSHPGPQATHFFAAQAADYIESHWPHLLGPKDENRPHDLAINDWVPFDLNVRQTSPQSFELEYPATTSLMFQPPGEPPTVLLALRYPLPLESIALRGNSIHNVQLWVSLLHPGDPYDELRWHELPGDGAGRFVLPPEMVGRSVAEIRFRCEFAGSGRHLEVILKRSTESTERR